LNSIFAEISRYISQLFKISLIHFLRKVLGFGTRASRERQLATHARMHARRLYNGWRGWQRRAVSTPASAAAAVTDPRSCSRPSLVATSSSRRLAIVRIVRESAWSFNALKSSSSRGICRSYGIIFALSSLTRSDVRNYLIRVTDEMISHSSASDPFYDRIARRREQRQHSYASLRNYIFESRLRCTRKRPCCDCKEKKSTKYKFNSIVNILKHSPPLIRRV
jgi:hypothetical protein